MDWIFVCAVRVHILARAVYLNVTVVKNTAITYMDANLHKVCLLNMFTKQNKAFTKKSHSFYHLCLEVREDTTLSLSYEYTPLGVNSTTSTRMDNKTGELFALFCFQNLCYIINMYFFDCMIHHAFYNRRKMLKMN